MRLSVFKVGLVVLAGLSSCGEGSSGGGTLPVPDLDDEIVVAPAGASGGLLTAAANTVDTSVPVQVTNLSTGATLTGTSSPDGAIALRIPDGIAGSELTVTVPVDGEDTVTDVAVPAASADYSVNTVNPGFFEGPDRERVTGLDVTVTVPAGRAIFARAVNLSSGANSDDASLSGAESVRILLPARSGDELAVFAFDSADRSLISEAILLTF